METEGNKPSPSAPADNPPVIEPLTEPKPEPEAKPANKRESKDDSPPPIQPLPNVTPEANHSEQKQKGATGGIAQSDKPAKIVPVPEAHRVTPLEHLGQTPEWIDCPWCQRMTKTRVTQDSSDMTSMAAVLCCLTCGICCICLPCLMGYAQDTSHHCTNCNHRVACKPHDGPIQVLAPRPTGKVISQYAPVGVVQAPEGKGNKNPISSPPAAQLKSG